MDLIFCAIDAEEQRRPSAASGLGHVWEEWVCCVCFPPKGARPAVGGQPSTPPAPSTPARIKPKTKRKRKGNMQTGPAVVSREPLSASPHEPPSTALLDTLMRRPCDTTKGAANGPH